MDAYLKNPLPGRILGKPPQISSQEYHSKGQANPWLPGAVFRIPATQVEKKTLTANRFRRQRTRLRPRKTLIIRTPADSPLDLAAPNGTKSFFRVYFRCYQESPVDDLFLLDRRWSVRHSQVTAFKKQWNKRAGSKIAVC
jgi:hypothetical protein